MALAERCERYDRGSCVPDSDVAVGCEGYRGASHHDLVPGEQRTPRVTAVGQWSADTRASYAALLAPRSGDDSIDIPLEPLRKIRREALGELAQRPETARVPLPNVLDAVMVGVADAVLELHIEGLAEQLLDVRWIAPSERR
jgi:hypothetical protein